MLDITDKERSCLVEMALYHDVTDTVDSENIISVILQLMSFQCLTIFRDWHIMYHELTDELAEHVMDIWEKWRNEGGELDVDIDSVDWLLKLRTLVDGEDALDF